MTEEEESNSNKTRMSVAEGEKKGEQDKSTTEEAKDDDDEDEDVKETTEVSCYAAQFRGRGLLCRPPRELPMSVAGITYRVQRQQRDNHDYDNDVMNLHAVHVEGTFRTVYEWHHEHDVNKMENNMEGEHSFVDRAVDWFQLSQSIHDPIPCEDL